MFCIFLVLFQLLIVIFLCFSQGIKNVAADLDDVDNVIQSALKAVGELGVDVVCWFFYISIVLYFFSFFICVFIFNVFIEQVIEKGDSVCVSTYSNIDVGKTVKDVKVV